MSDLKIQFDEVVNYIQNVEGDFQFFNEMKLEFYVFYKQVIEGDVFGKCLGMMDFVVCVKYDVWVKLEGIFQDEVMQQYIDKLNVFK